MLGPNINPRSSVPVLLKIILVWIVKSPVQNQAIPVERVILLLIPSNEYIPSPLPVRVAPLFVPVMVYIDISLIVDALSPKADTLLKLYIKSSPLSYTGYPLPFRFRINCPRLSSMISICPVRNVPEVTVLLGSVAPVNASIGRVASTVNCGAVLRVPVLLNISNAETLR